MYQAGETICEEFTVSAPAGGVADASAIPTGRLVRNGAFDPAVALTVERLVVGCYVVRGTIPAAYQAGDKLAILIEAVVNGTSAAAFLPLGRLGPLEVNVVLVGGVPAEVNSSPWPADLRAIGGREFTLDSLKDLFREAVAGATPPRINPAIGAGGASHFVALVPVAPVPNSEP